MQRYALAGLFAAISVSLALVAAWGALSGGRAWVVAFAAAARAPWVGDAPPVSVSPPPRRRGSPHAWATPPEEPGQNNRERWPSRQDETAAPRRILLGW